MKRPIPKTPTRSSVLAFLLAFLLIVAYIPLCPSVSYAEEPGAGQGDGFAHNPSTDEGAGDAADGDAEGTTPDDGGPSGPSGSDVKEPLEPSGIAPASDQDAQGLLGPLAVGDPYLKVGGTVFFDGAKQDYSDGFAAYSAANNTLTLSGTVGTIEAAYLGAGFTIILGSDAVVVGEEAGTMGQTAIQVTGELIVDGSGKASVFGAVTVANDPTASYASNGSFTKKGAGSFAAYAVPDTTANPDAPVAIASADADFTISGGQAFFIGQMPKGIECGGSLRVADAEYFYTIVFSTLGAEVGGEVSFSGANEKSSYGIMSINLKETSSQEYNEVMGMLAAAGIHDVEGKFPNPSPNDPSIEKGVLKATGGLTCDSEGAVQLFTLEGFGVVVGGGITIHRGEVQIFSINGNGAKAGGDLVITGGRNILMMGLFGFGLELPGDVILSGGTSTILGITLEGQAGVGFNGLRSTNGNAYVSGGNHTVVGTGSGDADWGMHLPEGSLSVTGGMLTVVSPTRGGLFLDKGDIEVTGGKLDCAGAFIGMKAEEIRISNGVANAFARGVANPGGSTWGELYRDYFDAVEQGDTDGALGAFLGTESNAGSNETGYAMLSRGSVSIANATVNAFAFLNSSGGAPGSNLKAIGIHADTMLAMSGSTVVALADTDASSSMTIGLHAGDSEGGAPGLIQVANSTVTAYGFQRAATRLAMFVELAGVIQLQPGTAVAAGAAAPGAQIPTYDQTLMSQYPYIYASPGRLYLDDVYVKWDYLDQALVQDQLCFGPPNGQHIITREMMQSLIGLDRYMFLLSDNVGLSQGSWTASILYAVGRSQALDPDNPNAPIYYSPAFTGNGVVFVFKTGRLAKKTTIHQVDGVEFYDFGSRYDTDPEHAAFLGLVKEGDQLIHSVHFNYTDEFPADMMLLLAVGEEWAEKQVSWYYLNEAGDATVWILDQAVDPFGWLVLEGQPQVRADTAITGPAGQPQPLPKTLAKVGDEVCLPLALAGMLAAISWGAVLLSRKRCR